MTGCWARKTSPDQHTCTEYACDCDRGCDRLPVDALGLCGLHRDELVPEPVPALGEL